MTHLLVCVDFSDVTQAVLAEARKLAGALRAKVTLLHVAPPQQNLLGLEPDLIGLEPVPQVPTPLIAPVRQDTHRGLESLAQQFDGAAMQCQAILVEGSVVQSIDEHARQMAVDMIIVGSHGHGALYHALVGSVTEGLLRQARQPVLVVRSQR
ncbi:MAG: universal stress protein [Phycisphaeraceae bacterium]